MNLNFYDSKIDFEMVNVALFFSSITITFYNNFFSKTDLFSVFLYHNRAKNFLNIIIRYIIKTPNTIFSFSNTIILNNIVRISKFF